MSADVTNEMECCRKFLEHRAALPATALIPYAGRWIAWSPDGARIVAVSPAPEDLDDRIRAAGEDPERCVVEGVPTTDAMLVARGLAWRDHEVSLHRPSDSSAGLPPSEAPSSVFDPLWSSRFAAHPARVPSVRPLIPGPMTRFSPHTLPRAWESTWPEHLQGKPGESEAQRYSTTTHQYSFVCPMGTRSASGMRSWASWPHRCAGPSSDMRESCNTLISTSWACTARPC